MQLIKTRKLADKIVLTVSGNLTAEDVHDLKSSFLEALEYSNEVELQIEDLTGIDLLCLQLLCATHRMAIKANKSFSIPSCCPTIFVNVVNRAGFPRHKGCMKKGGDACLWLKASR